METMNITIEEPHKVVTYYRGVYEDDNGEEYVFTLVKEDTDEMGGWTGVEVRWRNDEPDNQEEVESQIEKQLIRE
jgi:hypothetical protein